MEDKKVYSFDPAKGFFDPIDTPIEEKTEAKGITEPEKISEKDTPEPPRTDLSPNIETLPQDADETVEEGGVIETPEQHEQPEEREAVSSDNFYIAALETLKKNGDLPEDFNMESFENEEDLSNNIFEAYKNTLKDDVYHTLSIEFQREMLKNGYTRETLELANLLNHGVPLDQMQDFVDYKTLSSVDVEAMAPEDLREFVGTMYEDKGFGEKEIEKILSASELDGEIKDLGKNATAYFKEREKAEIEKAREVAKHNEKLRLDQQRYTQNVLNTVFQSGEIGGEKLTDQQLDMLDTSLNDRTVQVNWGGKIYNLTPFEEFMSKVQNDFSFQLYMFKKSLFDKQEKQAAVAEGKKLAEKDFAKTWVKKSTSFSSKDTAPIKGTHVYEGGEIKTL